MPEAVTTFLFTDIEGSTRLWEEQPERMRTALANHDRIARAMVERHRGEVVKTTGDGVHAAFADPLDAILATVALQHELANAAATGGIALPVRCGLHAGPHEKRDGDFFGNVVNRAARIMSAAHGGQMLVSHAVAERVSSRLPEGILLRELGMVRLRDLSSAERIFQVVHPALRSDFPALRSLEDTPNNLPETLSSFVGREREMAEIAARLREHRLVTLLGTGGVGKSRLSLHVAADRLEEHRHGVWLVELASLQDPRRVAQAIAASLAVKEEPGKPIEAALARHVKSLEMLVILDNCEHVLEGCAEAARHLLAAGAGVRILATSREPLRLAGETTYLVRGLNVPGPRVALTAESAGQHAAVQLFVQRARAASPGFALTDENAPAVAAICHRLDGIPLAIELAAARVRSIAISQIAARLKDRFRLLTSGDPTASPRQRTLRAMIDWSHDLLPAEERALFRRLAVFAGGWTLEAAEQVCAIEGMEPEAIVDALSRLVEKSLVTTDSGVQRYGMLETVREYARERLAESPEADSIGGRHRDFFLALAESARRQLAGPQESEWLARLDSERENILSVQDWCIRKADAHSALRLLNATLAYWLKRGPLGLTADAFDEALDNAPEGEAADLRARALFGAGQLRYFMGQVAEARRRLEESLAIARQLGGPYVAAVLRPLGMAAIEEGDISGARRCMQESLELAEERGDAGSIAGSLHGLAMTYRVEGRSTLARPLYERALGIYDELGNAEDGALARLNLAMVAVDEGRLAEALQLVARAIALDGALESVRVRQSIFEVGAGLAVERGECGMAARLLGTAQAQAQASGIRRDRADKLFLEPRIARAREALGEAGFAAAEGEWAGRGFAYAVAALRDWLVPAAAASAREGVTASR